ncbi:12826_t:CDS:2, partial [Cetraspora pellucida]
ADDLGVYDDTEKSIIVEQFGISIKTFLTISHDHDRDIIIIKENSNNLLPSPFTKVKDKALIYKLQDGQAHTKYNRMEHQNAGHMRPSS